MNEKLVLNNRAKIDIENSSSIADMKVLSDTKYGMVSVWDMLTEENLKHIEIQNEDGTAIGTYDNILIESETSTIQP